MIVLWHLQEDLYVLEEKASDREEPSAAANLDREDE